MAHTYSSNFIHCIFSTKERKPLIAADRKTDLYAYLGGIARSEVSPSSPEERPTTFTSVSSCR
jgi:hypothetical protein